MSVDTANKNFPITPAGAGADLGLGDQLIQGIQNQLDEQRKQRLLAQAGGGQQKQNGFAAQALGLTGIA